VRGGEVFAERQDALRADKAADLRGERNERGEIDEPQPAQEQPRDQIVALGFERPPPKKMREPGEQPASP
jgi:hypothetical protein